MTRFSTVRLLLLIFSIRNGFSQTTWGQSQISHNLGAFVKWIVANNNIQAYSVRLWAESTEKHDFLLNYLGDYHPVLTGHFDYNSPKKGEPVIVIFLLLETELEFNKSNIIRWKTFLCNRRRDHYIFLGRQQIILTLWKIRKINQLGQRWGLAVDTKQFMGRIEGAPAQSRFFNNLNQFPNAQLRIGNNIRGRHIKFSGWAHVPPYHFIAGMDRKERAVYDGSHVRLLHAASQLFNFSFELYSDDQAMSYGEILQNGSWTGMLGDVYSGEYDVCLSLGPTLGWYHMFDFAGSLSSAGIGFLTPKPISEIHAEAFLRPFSLPLWILLAILFLTVQILIFILIKETSVAKESRFSGMLKSFILTFQIAMEQTAQIPGGVKLLCGAWLIVSIIFGSAYKSKMMSSLTFPFIEKPPNTYIELAHHKEYSSILNNIGSLEVEYFQSNESHLINSIAQTMTFEPAPMDCIVKTVLKRKSVCIGWFPFLEYVVAEWASPDLQISPILISVEPVMQITVSLAFQKYSPFSDGFTPIVTSFWESGIYRMWENDVLRIHKIKGVQNYFAKPDSPLNKRLKSIVDDIATGNTEKPLKLSNLKIMFLCLGSGFCIGCIMIVSEKIFYIYRYKKLRSRLRIQNTSIVTVRPVVN